MKKIVVTGGSGGSGRYVIRDLLANGYEVLNLDIVQPERELCPFIKVDLGDYAALEGAMKGYDALVHFAANPHPDADFAAAAGRFANNTVSTFNAFNAAAALGMERIVWASSETVFGYPYQNVKPLYVPLDEDHPLQPQNGYALSKVVCEELARHMNRLHGLPIIGLRFSNILYIGVDHPANYGAVPSYWPDPHSRKSNLWGYVDARDAAQSVRLSLQSDRQGAEVFIIAAADTIMNRPNGELMAEVYPGVPVKEGTTDFESLLSIGKARTLLGYQPQYSWRDLHQA